ncbi:histidine kinase [Elizabethkingia sp. HX XZB]|uniref:sensor histidine kinase n=1 Tax=Elizabethkingia sp. HX XZB TaxID=3003193 RepID=UPI002A240882|nr:histidine kinase [Elizabethkingia sp. HX XZB]MDX8568171.1 histidine kinase [Elizabethkingia sp. HX XZB]
MYNNKIKNRLVFILIISGVFIFFRYIVTPVSQYNHLTLSENISTFIYDIITFIALSWLIKSLGEAFFSKINDKNLNFKQLLRLCMIQTGILLLITIAFIIFQNYFFHKIGYLQDKNWLRLKELVFILIWVSIVVFGAEMGKILVKKWKQSVSDYSNLSQKMIFWQLTALKMQLDPHFMFNNYSVLNNLIKKDPQKAGIFLDKLSNIQQYLHQNIEHDLVTLEQEITFIQQYFYLMKIRYKERIDLNINIKAFSSHIKIPPLTLQLLIENALKHNKATLESPLIISIGIEDNFLIVENNLQVIVPLSSSSKIGLNNIRERYQLLGDQQITIEKTRDKFTIRLPLL